jgi:phenylalanyl-tRNA synthetase beta subunit
MSVCLLQFDEYTHPKTGRKSLAYQINYRSMDRSVYRLACVCQSPKLTLCSPGLCCRVLTNTEIVALHDEVSRKSEAKFGVEVR